MKNYELISELSKLPAGADVRIKMIKNRDELAVLDANTEDEAYNIEFPVSEVYKDKEGVIELDGW